MTDPISRDNAALDEPLEYLIYKSGRGWYRPNSSGYTSFKFDAGRYSEIDAIDITHPNGPDGPRDGMFYKHQDQVRDFPSSRIEALEIEVERLRGLVDAIRMECVSTISRGAHIRKTTSSVNQLAYGRGLAEAAKNIRAALNNNGEGE